MIDDEDSKYTLHLRYQQRERMYLHVTKTTVGLICSIGNKRGEKPILLIFVSVVEGEKFRKRDYTAKLLSNNHPNPLPHTPRN